MRTKKPNEEYRYVTKFLWFPKLINGEWIWLEKVTIRQAYLLVFGVGTWCDVCLSNPLTGLPIELDPPMSSDWLEHTPGNPSDMLNCGKYYVISGQPLKVEKR